MNNKKYNRRRFIGNAAAASVAGVLAGSLPTFGQTKTVSGVLAALGGGSVTKRVWPKWPYVDNELVESMMETTKNGWWSRIDNRRASKVSKLENDFAPFHDVKYVVATGSGTQAISTAVHALNIECGDEVITSPYTDMGTISGVITSRALPVFADLDPDSFQLDAKDAERKITKRTKALLPVHMMGSPSDIRAFVKMSKDHKLLLIEDACQAHLAKVDGKRIGTFGDVGCFSFQSSKVMAAGEGGACITNDEGIADTLYTVMNHGSDKRGRHTRIGPKYRMNEFAASALLSQMRTHMQRHDIRNRNAKYLTQKLKDFKGVAPQKLYPGTEECSYYLYALDFKPEQWNGASRAQFIKAVQAEGVPIGPYIPSGLHKYEWVDFICNLDVYKKMYGGKRLKEYKEMTLHLPNCDSVADRMLLIPGSGPLTADISAMDDIINAFNKVWENRDKLKSIKV
ncbi:MAG: DegT/DnrJ/EryC1/StrS family aminotransferase [Niabella sp.]